MSGQGVEGLINDTATYLGLNLGAKLTEVDARYSNIVGLEDVVEWRIDDPLVGRLPDKLPLGWIIAPTTTIDQWGQSYAWLQADLVVWVLIRDSDASKLRRRIYRTMLAIWETLAAAHFDSGVPWAMLDTPEMDFAEILTVGGLVLSDARIRIRVAQS